jgi:TPP-dependent pyruvate/acetoin dehydrogenase alpha subunit
MPGKPLSQPEQFYRTMFLIRRFEETVLENFPRGVFSGTTHTYLGQEANAVGVMSCVQTTDIVFSNHRCHGHFLAYGGDARGLFAELMGKSTGVCGGRGGSQHLQWRNFYSNGVQGGIVPVATGMALAEKIKNSPTMAVAFLGDGTLGEGAVYEALNMATLWQAPILYVVENNHIAQTTPVESAVAGDILARFTSFDIPGLALDTSDVQEIALTAKQLIAGIRSSGGPRVLLLHTCRFGPHSKGDDTRNEGELERLRNHRDPLKLLSARLGSSTCAEIEATISDLVAQAFRMAIDDPMADPRELDLAA